MSRNHSMSLESNSVVSCVLKWILILFVLNHLVCKQAVFYIIVIVTHLPLNWRNDCGCFSFPLIGHAHCTELSLVRPTVLSCHWPRPLYRVVIGHAHCAELSLATPTVLSCHWFWWMFCHTARLLRSRRATGNRFVGGAAAGTLPQVTSI